MIELLEEMTKSPGNFKFGRGKDDMVVRSVPGPPDFFLADDDGVGRSESGAHVFLLVAGRPRAICWMDISKFSTADRALDLSTVGRLFCIPSIKKERVYMPTSIYAASLEGVYTSYSFKF